MRREPHVPGGAAEERGRQVHSFDETTLLRTDQAYEAAVGGFPVPTP